MSSELDPVVPREAVMHAGDCASHVFRPFPCSCGVVPASGREELREENERLRAQIKVWEARWDRWQDWRHESALLDDPVVPREAVEAAGNVIVDRINERSDETWETVARYALRAVIATGTLVPVSDREELTQVVTMRLWKHAQEAWGWGSREYDDCERAAGLIVDTLLGSGDGPENGQATLTDDGAEP